MACPLVPELRDSFTYLFETGSYSDLVVKSSVKTYNVHKAIICPRSAFFKAVCRGSFRESLTGVVELIDDDPEAVDLMMTYFYHLSYDLLLPPGVPMPTSPFNSAGVRRSSYNETSQVLMPPSSHLMIHAKAFAIADKYDVPRLCNFATDHFKRAAAHHWNTDAFLDAAEFVFSSTPAAAKQFRLAIVEIVMKHSLVLVEKERLLDMIDDTDALGAYQEVRKHRRLIERNDQLIRSIIASSRCTKEIGYIPKKIYYKTFADLDSGHP